jgi:hypothetical protein
MRKFCTKSMLATKHTDFGITYFLGFALYLSLFHSLTTSHHNNTLYGDTDESQ